jgi:outer membrane immunogenic protein
MIAKFTRCSFARAARNRLLLSCAALSICVCAQGVLAADLAPLYKAPAYVPAFSWTGCYSGGNIGGLWAQKDWTVAAPSTPVGAVEGTNYPTGVLGGSQVGCNYQVGTWVIGIQGDGDWAHAIGTTSDLLAAGLQDRSRVMWLASVTGRLGYTWGRFLGYVKGGGAWERDNYDTSFVPSEVLVSAASETRSGWTVGIGGEYAFWDFLTGFVEYDYYDFGTRTNAFAVVNGAGAPTGAVNYVDIRERQSVVKAGFNLKFMPKF